MSTTLRPLAITQGDPAGIGPEIVAKAFRDAPADLQMEAAINLLKGKL